MSRLFDRVSTLYAQAGVIDVMLEAQDRYGQNIALLLTLVALRQDGRGLADSDLEALAEAAEIFETAAILPLRAVRRGLKTPPADVGAVAAERIRDKVKAAELEAETALIDAMEQIAAEAKPHPVEGLESLLFRMVRARKKPAPRSEISRWAHVFSA